jgi:hypothetical protein
LNKKANHLVNPLGSYLMPKFSGGKKVFVKIDPLPDYDLDTNSRY